MKQQTLQALQADYTVFYHTMRDFHWNVTGPFFFTLHEQFEKLYRFAELTVDRIAERLRALEYRPLRSFHAILEFSRIQEIDTPNSADAMVDQTLAHLKQLNGTLNEALNAFTDDPVTEELLIHILEEQEKFRWMFDAYRTTAL